MSCEFSQNQPLLNPLLIDSILHTYSNESSSVSNSIRSRDQNYILQIDRDIHPYGETRCYSDIIFGQREVKVKLDHTKFLAWISFVVFLLIISATIIVLAEFERTEWMRATGVNYTRFNKLQN